MTGQLAPVRQILSTDDLMELQKQADQVYVDPELMEYAVRLVGATRRPDQYGLSELMRYISFGASPRASINLILGARALALTRGRDYVIPPDISELAPDVMRHRLVLSYEALADRVTADAIIDAVLDHVKQPQRPFNDTRLQPAAAASTGVAVEERS
jgi:MoxR-like ATPase